MNAALALWQGCNGFKHSDPLHESPAAAISQPGGRAVVKAMTHDFVRNFVALLRLGTDYTGYTEFTELLDYPLQYIIYPLVTPDRRPETEAE